MNLVVERFDGLRRAGRKALITYMMGGDPGLKESAKLLDMLSEAGADFIEVGAPFSDPLADGPVIQSAGQRALRNGCTLEKLLAALKPAVRNVDAPVILMIYYNMIFQRGAARFVDECLESGVAGLIVPDLLPEDAGELWRLADGSGIGLNFLVAPTSSEARIDGAAEASTGFLYAVSLKGVTGVRSQLPADLPEFIRKVRSRTHKPVAVGFGIGSPEQARRVAEIADGAIVGSAVVQAAFDDPGFEKVTQLVRGFKAAITA